MKPTAQQSSFTAPLLALALAATGCATVSRPVEPTQLAEAPQALVGKLVRFVDASGQQRELVVEWIRPPLLRGSRAVPAAEAGPGSLNAVVFEDVDLRTVHWLVVVETTGHLSRDGEILVDVAGGIVKGIVLLGLGLLVLVL